MKSLRNLAFSVGLLAFLACSSGQSGSMNASDKGGPKDCSTVRCRSCPEGQTPALQPPDCCRCVPIDPNVTDCSNVRCASCPAGSHPALEPPDCCRCVPD